LSRVPKPTTRDRHAHTYREPPLGSVIISFELAAVVELSFGGGMWSIRLRVALAELTRLPRGGTFPFAPRLKPLRARLAKFAPPMPKAPPPSPIAGTSKAAIRRSKWPRRD
jgi:hypothetical protein